MLATERNFILENVRKHIQLSEADSDFFIDLLDRKLLLPGDFLQFADRVSEVESFVVNGCLKVFSNGKEGIQNILMFRSEGEWVGDIYSFLTKMPSNYMIQAVEETIIMQIVREDLTALYRKIPVFENFFGLVLEEGFNEYQARVNQVSGASPAEKYRNFVIKYPSLSNRLRLEEIATYIGISPEFLVDVKNVVA